jgi:hypothetical protein
LFCSFFQLSVNRNSAGKKQQKTTLHTLNFEGNSSMICIKVWRCRS